MMAAVFKFVSSDHQTAPKRLQTSKACTTCRRRKKRCMHGDKIPTSSGTFTHDDSMSTGPQRLSESQPVSHEWPGEIEAADRQVTGGASQLSGQDEQAEPTSLATRNARFIGDLNPEGIFLAATSPNATRGASLDDSIGVWLNTSLSKHGPPRTSHVSQSPSNLFYRSGSLIQKVLIPMLEQECLSTIPPPNGLEILARAYFDKVYPIFPVVSESTLRQSAHLSTPDRIILQQGICLAASRNQASRQYLTLGNVTPLSCREFGEKISGAMRMSIEMGLVTNKIVLIQALALLSQFTDDPPGEDLSSQFCMRAVHQVQSLGLHIKGQEEHADYDTTLLCCIWAMDRMNAAFNGRPVSMHERDLRKDLDRCFQQQETPFRLFLEVVALLDKVIELYRPSALSGDSLVLSWEFPAFEDIVLRCGSSNVGTTALASVEVLYHAIAILSCRTKSWADPERSSTAFLRQSLSTSVLSSTFGRTPQDQFILFPFIPYAMSLSMSIAYREMRHSKLPIHRARSRGQFQTICDALSGLEGIFWSASTTSEMGKKLLKEMDRVFSTVSSSENMRSNQHTSSISHGGAGISGHGMATQNAVLPNPDIQQPDLSMQDFDPSIFDSMTNIDLFGMFDPAFDLDGFDACLEGNLNPGFPSGLQ